MTDYSDWRPRNLRLTVFSNDDLSEIVEKWWKNLKDIERISKTTNENIGETTLIGKLDKTKIIISNSSIKTDFIFTTQEELDIENINLSTLGEFKKENGKFDEITKYLLKTEIKNSIKRIAFGSTLIRQLKDKNEGYIMASDIFKQFKLNGNDYSDFKFEINKPVKSGVIEKLSLNRLIRLFILNLKAQSPLMGGIDSKTVVDKHMFLLEMDINTDKEYKDDIKSELIEKLYLELKGVSVDILKKGLV